MSIYTMRTKFGAGLKVILILIAIVFLIGAFWQFGAPGGPSSGGRQQDNTTVAVVNNTNIPMSAFNAKWETARENASQQGIRSLLAFADVKTSVISGLIQQTQLLQVAKDMGIDISQSKVDNEIDKIVLDALKANRRVAMGELSKEKEAIDPRKDNAYSKTLAGVGRSIKSQEEEIRSRIPEEEVKAKLAQDGIMAKIKEETKNISDNDIKDSYKSYTIRQILISKGKVSDEQLLTKAQNIVKEARSGKDFVSLAVANSDLPDKSKGSPMNYSFDTRFVVLPEVAQAIERLKPGQISDPVELDMGFFIIQLLNSKSNAPAKMDKKTTDERRQMIVQDRESQKIREIGKLMSAKSNVEIKDPELNFLYLVDEAGRKSTSREEMIKKLKAACASFQETFKLNTVTKDNTSQDTDTQRNLSDIARARYAQVLAEIGDNDQAIKVLSQMVMGSGATTPSADMSKLLGDLLVKAKKIDQAIKCYQDASDMAYFDMNLRRSLVVSYKAIGRNDLAAIESALIAKKEKDIKIWEEKNKGTGQALPGHTPSQLPVQIP